MSPLLFFSVCTSCEFVLAGYVCEFVVNKVCILLYSWLHVSAIWPCYVEVPHDRWCVQQAIFVAGVCRCNMSWGPEEKGTCQVPVLRNSVNEIILKENFTEQMEIG